MLWIILTIVQLPFTLTALWVIGLLIYDGDIFID